MGEHVAVAAVLFVVGAVNAVLAWSIGAGRLRRNYYVGIRTSAAMRDDESWAAAHQAALAATRWAAVLGLMSGALVLVVQERAFTVIAWVPPMVVMIVAAVTGDRAARRSR